VRGSFRPIAAIRRARKTRHEAGSSIKSRGRRLYSYSGPPGRPGFPGSPGRPGGPNSPGRPVPSFMLATQKRVTESSRLPKKIATSRGSTSEEPKKLNPSSLVNVLIATAHLSSPSKYSWPEAEVSPATNQPSTVCAITSGATTSRNAATDPVISFLNILPSPLI
jgi:hypothetical protein